MDSRRPFSFNLFLIVVLVLVTTGMQPAGAATAPKLEISRAGAGTYELAWEAIPGETYHVETATDFVNGPWVDLTPGGLVTPHVTGAYTDAFADSVRFFRIYKEDTSPPEVVALLPGDDAIAVASDADVSIILTDETGIDASSIVLSVADWPGMTLAGGQITYEDSTLAFTPPGALGEPGDVITCTLTVADTLGHTLTDYTWTFGLALAVEATDDFLPLTAPPAPVPAIEPASGKSAMMRTLPKTAPPGAAMKAASDRPAMLRTLPNVQPQTDNGYYIVEVTEDTVVFSYTGDPPVITEGRRLVSFDAAHPFYREAVSSEIDTEQQLVTVTTTDINLTDLVEEGSLSSSDFTAAEATETGGVTATAGFNLLHVEFGDDLSGTVLYEDSGLKLHLPSASWSFIGDVDVALDLSWFELQSLDASATGTLTLDVTPEAIFYQAISGGGSVPLVPPVTHIFGGMAGPVPVWVEVTLELNAGFEYSASVSGNAYTTVHADKELTFSVRLRDEQWSCGFDNPPMVFEADPITWQLAGTANAKVYIQPKLTVLVYSLAGLWVDIKPYAEMDGWYQANPQAWDLALYFGISSTLGIESRLPFLPTTEWQLFDQRWPVWQDSYSEGSTSVPPTFAGPFPDRTVVVGSNLTLSGHASGTPAPSYRWYYNGSPITGASSPEYTISSAQYGHAGTYTVEAYNSAGSVQASCNVTVISGTPPSGMVLVPAGTFQMGDALGGGNPDEVPVHSVYVSAFYMDKYEVTKAKWDEVCAWAIANGYSFNNAGSGKGTNHPVHTIDWYDAVKWCNARSEKEGRTPCYYTSAAKTTVYRTGQMPVANDWVRWDANGYRLPTEAEWEKAARGGLIGRRFPWGDTIQHARANYYSSSSYFYDTSPTRGYHPTYAVGGYPYTNPAGDLPPNGYGLYDMAGNVWEWCHDWYASGYYTHSPDKDPTGPATGTYRVLRGGSWDYDARACRSAYRLWRSPNFTYRLGFRVVVSVR